MSTESTSSSSQESRPADILVVDDTTENRQILVQLLQREGYRVRAASTGKLALMSCETAAPDLMLLDISMPEMDGYEVCRRMKQSPALQRIPILFLSARTETNDKVAAFEAGGVDYITKPFEPTETLSRVRTHLRIAQLQRELEAMNTTLEARVKERTRELEESMERLRQAEKMELVGRLAGGVAHDFNNLLTCILGNVELARMRTQPDAPVLRFLDDVELAARRSADLTYQLLAFARKQVIQPRLLSLNQCVNEAERLLQRTLGEHIKLVCELSPTPPMVMVDPGQISQVIINMGVNARDAMPKGGRLNIKASFETLDDSVLKEYPDVRPGRYAVLTVADTGTGIVEAEQKRIFEPFYTTKKPGKGTGLGLATTYGIIKQHGGHIALKSVPGEGTTFSVYLPLCEDKEPLPAHESSGTAPAIGGTPTVLLCEDDDLVREVVEAALSDIGYTILVAQDGDQGLKMALACPQPISLLITDFVMPSISGLELERRLRETQPHVKVLFITGYAENAISSPGANDKRRQLLQKPFSPKELFKKVREMIEG